MPDFSTFKWLSFSGQGHPDPIAFVYGIPKSGP
jgi:hypothetical protein